jgi:hypothetical protein
MPIGSIAGGLIGQGGANAAASGISNASSGANFQMMQQRKENRSDLSPWTSTGTSAIGQIGSLLGYGALWNRGGDGATYNYEQDPNAQKNALANLRGYVDASGVAAPTFTPINTISSTFTEDPSYQWRLGEGMKALDRSAASRGLLLSGAQAKGVSDYNQGLASTEYQNWLNNWMRQNAYNWGGQQAEYGMKYGQWRDALGDVFNAAGMGQGATNTLAGTNSGLSTAGGNALLSGAVSAGNATMQGANALASGIGSGINNAMTLGYMGWGGANPIFGGRSSSYDPEANMSGLLRGGGPAGPSGRY